MMLETRRPDPVLMEFEADALSMIPQRFLSRIAYTRQSGTVYAFARYGESNSLVGFNKMNDNIRPVTCVESYPITPEYVELVAREIIRKNGHAFLAFERPSIRSKVEQNLPCDLALEQVDSEGVLYRLTVS